VHAEGRSEFVPEPHAEGRSEGEPVVHAVALTLGDTAAVGDAAALADGEALVEAENEEGQLPPFTSEILKRVTVCVQTAPPVAAVKPKNADVAFAPPPATLPKKSAKFTVMRCVKLLKPPGVDMDANMAQPHAS
jgi:hypothetical protein